MLETVRAHCYRCDKPAAMCLCDRIPRVSHRTGITIVQHPRERAHPFGTARIARLGLERCEVRVARGEALSSFDDRRVTLPVSFLPGTAVLYPRHDAPSLESLSIEERPARLVVLDGTWSQAKRLWADNPELASLPCVRLDPSAPSRYRIRREPSFAAISTLEAIVLALSILEPEREPELSALLAAFDAMIDDQLDLRSGRSAAPRRKLRRRAHRPPAALFAPIEQLVLVDTEHRRGEGAPAMMRLSAVRLASGELLDVFVGGTPGRAHLDHMGVGEERFDSAVSDADALASLVAFLRDDDVVLAWHQLPLRLVAPAVGARATVGLKAAFCNLEGGRCGALDELIARVGLEPDPVRVDGRMGPWLANAACITRWLRRRAAS